VTNAGSSPEADLHITLLLGSYVRMSDSLGTRTGAPLFSIPDLPIVAVEHPCIVQNVDKAIRMLGGDSEIAETLEPNNVKPLGLKFQPDDPTSREVVSYNRKTNNLLLKVTVPKRTGRKRKRGSNEEFSEHPPGTSARKDVEYLLRSLKDNTRHSQAEIVGQIRSTHAWRTLPDFVYTSKGSMFLKEVRTKILPQDYPHLKQWSMPRALAAAAADTEAIPPPVFSTQSLPRNFSYRQDTSVKTITRKFTLRDGAAPAEAMPDASQLGEEKQREDTPPESGAALQTSDASAVFT
jgi:general transcription factor 3C polypeptide 5 (transcription factor C subunit 1)